ncbi:MAG TPA: hypothetical protein VJN18_36105 [Polyangiaceae bacterium]|nr:hypothetical protein [Polyangiaceae bacterium]
MMRTAIGLAFLVALALGGMSACSGDSKDEATGKAGSGGTGGASSAGSGGANSQSGSSGNSGNSAGPCAGKMNMCVDAQTVTGCDPATGMDFTTNCEEGLEEGFVNLGCDTSSQGTKACLVDVEDLQCWEGALIFNFCFNGPEADAIRYYLGCFHDMNGAKTVIPCYIPFLDEPTRMVDCNAAAEACLPPLGGGGAPSDGGAGPGAGGDPGAGGGG